MDDGINNKETTRQVGPGSQSALRQRNKDLLLNDLTANGPATQRELADRTGLSTATISNLIKILQGECRVSTQQTVSSSRRAVLVEALGQ
jgi:DNA-binding MarR family transcriptional regulator